MKLEKTGCKSATRKRILLITDSEGSSHHPEIYSKNANPYLPNIDLYALCGSVCNLSLYYRNFLILPLKLTEKLSDIVHSNMERLYILGSQ